METLETTKKLKFAKASSTFNSFDYEMDVVYEGVSDANYNQVTKWLIETFKINGQEAQHFDFMNASKIPVDYFQVAGYTNKGGFLCYIRTNGKGKVMVSKSKIVAL